MNRILVTGGAGFLGRHCLAALRGEVPNASVFATTSSSFARPGELATWRRCDLHDESSVARLIEAVRPTHLLHLAWITTHGVYWTSPENERWLASSRRIVDEFLRCGGERLVIAGTCAEYEWTAGVCDEARTPTSRATPYADCKHRLREWAERAASRAGAEFAWGRVFFAYGPGEPASRLIPSVIKGLSEGRAVPCSEGLHRRDFIHASDLGRAFARLVTGRVVGPVNLGSGRATSIADVVRTIEAIMGRPGFAQLGTRAEAPEPPLVVANVARLTDEVGFVPRFDLVSGLRDAISHWTGARKELADAA